eukprot:COSAG06_NODE_49886_length_322_cov_1.062780_1_plen_76_part_01
MARVRSASERQRRAVADAISSAESSVQARLDVELAATEAEIRSISSQQAGVAPQHLVSADTTSQLGARGARAHRGS